MYIIQKRFSGSERTYTPGELVEADGWRTLPRLLSQRYLRAATPAEIEAATAPAAAPPVPAARGRKGVPDAE